MFYPTAWAMFTFLLNTYPAELKRYPQLRSEDARAWTDAFPALDPARFDAELRAWLGRGKHSIWTFGAKLTDVAIAERALRDVDVYAARTILRHLSRQASDQLTRELDEVLRTDPSNLYGQLVAVARTRTIAIADARRVSQAYPDNWRAWHLVLRALNSKGHEAEAAFRRVCELVANDVAPKDLVRGCARAAECRARAGSPEECK